MKKTLLWVLVFVLAQSFVHPGGGGNQASRLVPLFSKIEGEDFKINSYINPELWTIDWAQAPSGFYYSNKAPAPTLIAYPFYAAFERFMLPQGAEHRVLRDEWRKQNLEKIGFVLALLFQVLPFALVVTALALKIESPSARLIFVAASLFANTGAFFMNSYFGHGFTTWTGLAAVWGLLNGHPLLAGLLMSFSLLSDYSAAFLLLSSFLGLLIWRRFRLNDWIYFLVGSLPAAVLWIWYHSTHFGGPFNIALAFQNPAFKDMSSEVQNFGGVIGFLPKLELVKNLLFGSARGLLLTQPWVLVVIASIVVIRKNSPSKQAGEWGFVALLYFALLFWMNASFGGWHGGASPGPRYLSAAFPILAYAGSLSFDEQKNRSFLKVCTILLLPSLVLYALIFSTQILLPVAPLWRETWRHLSTEFRIEACVRFAFLALTLLLLWIYSFKSLFRIKSSAF